MTTANVILIAQAVLALTLIGLLTLTFIGLLAFAITVPVRFAQWAWVSIRTNQQHKVV